MKNTKFENVDYSRVILRAIYLIFTAFIVAWFNNPKFLMLGLFIFTVKNERMIIKEVLTTVRDDAQTSFKM